MTKQRSSYIAKNAVKYDHKNSSAVAYVGNLMHLGKLTHVATLCHGRNQRPSETMYSLTLEDLNTRVTNWFLKVQQSEQKKQLDRTLSKEKAKVKSEAVVVGSILHCSWGYDQTQSDFYQVISKRNSMVELRRIDVKLEATGAMSGDTMPLINQWHSRSKILRKRLSGEGVKITDGQYASLWDGKPQYCSWYA
jgi:hypothetical protein